MGVGLSLGFGVEGFGVRVKPRTGAHQKYGTYMSELRDSGLKSFQV